MSKSRTRKQIVTAIEKGHKELEQLDQRECLAGREMVSVDKGLITQSASELDHFDRINQRIQSRLSAYERVFGIIESITGRHSPNPVVGGEVGGLIANHASLLRDAIQ